MQIPSPQHVDTPPELMREVFAAFDLYLDANGEEQQHLLAKLARENPEIARRLCDLIACSDRAADSDTLLGPPALERLARLTTHSDSSFAEASGPTRRSRLQAWSRPPWRRLLLGAGLVSFLLYVWVASLLYRFGDQSWTRGWDGAWTPQTMRVTQVDANGPADGKLFVGDQITAVNGSKEDVLPAFLRLPTVSNHGQYRVEILRGGRRFDVPLRVGSETVKDQVSKLLVFFVTSLLFCLSGLTIGLVKPDLKVTRLASVALVAEALVVLSTAIAPYDHLLGIGAALLDGLILISGVHFALAYHFYAAFYDELSQRNVRRPLIPLLYLWGMGNAVLGQMLFGIIRSPALLRHAELVPYIIGLRVGLFAIGPAAMVVLITVGYLRTRKQPNASRSRWITFGSLAGIAPYMIYRAVLLIALFFQANISEPVQDAALRCCILAAAAIPVCTAYAVLKHHVFDIRFIVRTGLQYILLTRTLQSLLLLPLLGMFVSLVRNRDRTVSQAVGHNLGLLLLILLLSAMLLARGRLQRSLDRRYGRDLATRARLRDAAGRAIRKAASLDMLEQIATEQVRLLFDPALLTLYLQREADGPFESRPSSPECIDLVLMASGELLHRLDQLRKPQQLAALQTALPFTRELARFDALGVQVVVPLISRDSFPTGVLLIGERRSQDPYGQDDLDLLDSLAEDIAAVCDALRLEQHLQAQQTLSEDMQWKLQAERNSYFLECPACGLCFDPPQERCERDASGLLRNRSSGRTIRERYRLERRVDKGGMGTVYESRDLKLNRTVALKLISPPPGPSASRWADRAVQEGCALARLSHPNIVTAHDCGTNEQGAAYLVMEFVRGQTLRNMLGHGPIAPATAASWLDQILGGLDSAHRAGIIHRDLKPENIMIVEEHSAKAGLKLLDFGIAKLTEGDGPSPELTLAGMRVGTPFYMSPEQFDCRPVDARSDLFSVAVLVIEMLNGELPLASFSVRDRFLGWLHGREVLPLSTDNDLLLKQLLDACLAHEPERRPASAAELRRTLVPLVRSYRGLSPLAV